jgi:hypothetical protein
MVGLKGCRMQDLCSCFVLELGVVNKARLRYGVVEQQPSG